MTIAMQYGHRYWPIGAPTSCCGSHGHGHRSPFSFSGAVIVRSSARFRLTASAGAMSLQRRIGSVMGWFPFLLVGQVRALVITWGGSLDGCRSVVCTCM